MNNTWRKFDATLDLPALMDYFGLVVQRKTSTIICYQIGKEQYIVIRTEFGYRYYKPSRPKTKLTVFDFILERLSRTDAEARTGLWTKIEDFYVELEKKSEFFLNDGSKNSLEIVDIGFNHFEPLNEELSLRPKSLAGDGSDIFQDCIYENPEGQLYFPYRNLANTLTGYAMDKDGKLSLIAESDISKAVWFSKVPDTIKHLVVLHNPMEAVAFHRRFQLENVIYLAISNINYDTSKLLVQILKRTKLKKMVLSFTGSSKIEGYIHDLMLISFINDSRFLFRVGKDHLAVRFDPEGQKPLAKLHNEVLKYNGSLAKEYIKYNKVPDQSLLNRKSIVLTKEKQWVSCRIPFEVNALRYFLWSYYRNYMDKTVEIVKPVHANWRLEFEVNGVYVGTEKLKAFRMAV